jgi:methanogenic corrinoid protein MtbC1
MRFIHENKLRLPELAGGVFADPKLHLELMMGNRTAFPQLMKTAALKGDVEGVLRLLRVALASEPDLLTMYAQTVFPPLVELGDLWSAGTVSVDQEHLATQTIRQALVRFQADVHVKPSNGLTALFSCYDGELHDIALYCIASYVRAEGWHTYYLGQSTPTDDLVRAVERIRPALVVLSAVIVEDEFSFLHDINDRLAPAAARSGAKLSIGGRQLVARFGTSLKADFISDSVLDYRRIADPRNYTHT